MCNLTQEEQVLCVGQLPTRKTVMFIIILSRLVSQSTTGMKYRKGIMIIPVV